MAKDETLRNRYAFQPDSRAMVYPFTVTERRCVSGFLTHERFLQAILLANVLS